MLKFNYILNSLFSYTFSTGSVMTTCRFSISISSFFTNAKHLSLLYVIKLLLIKLLQTMTPPLTALKLEG